MLCLWEHTLSKIKKIPSISERPLDVKWLCNTKSLTTFIYLKIANIFFLAYLLQIHLGYPRLLDHSTPCHLDIPAYSNSFDVFIRGEEIISGAQHVHVPELVSIRAESLGIDLKSIEIYIDAFRLIPHKTKLCADALAPLKVYKGNFWGAKTIPSTALDVQQAQANALLAAILWAREMEL